MPRVFKTRHPEETRKLAEEIAALLHPGDLILLYGDLGTGKTVFVQGLARGLGVPEDFYVVSPSFALINEYPGRMILYHVDLYRLTPEEVEDLGLWELLPKGVMVVEWAERLERFPRPRFCIYLKYLSENEREIRVEENLSDAQKPLLLEEQDKDA